MRSPSEIVLTLIDGVGMLAILAIAYGAIRRSPLSTRGQAMLFGVATALAAIVTTMNPTVIVDGILADNRALIVGIGAAFGGPLTALIAGVSTGAFRLYLGGVGAVLGIAALGVAISAGLLWRVFLYRSGHHHLFSLLLLGLGIAAHAGLVLAAPISAPLQVLTMGAMMVSSILSALLLGSLMLREDLMIRRESELAAFAHRDPLTKVANRRAFDLELEAIGKDEASACFAILVLDIDHFKSVNDRFGHVAGDVVLRAIAMKLTKAVGKEAFVARFGGEEFVVLLKNTGPLQALSIAEAARRHIADWRSSGETSAIAITVSIGLACASDMTETNSLLQRADEALYAAKAAGRNCVRVWQNPRDEKKTFEPERRAPEARTYAVAS